MHTAGRHRGRGFTLVEALLAAVILAMAVGAIIMPFTVGAQNEQVDARRTVAVGLAQEMMEEVLSKPFDDPDGPSGPGPEPGESSRSSFDNMDDYDGYAEAAGTITNIDGEVIDEPAATALSRHVSADYVYVSGQDMSGDPTFVRVVVEMQYKNQAVVALTRLVYKLN